MILGDCRILRLVEEKKLLENYSSDCLESAGYDLRLGRAYKLASDSFIGVKDRRTPKVVELEGDSFTLKPGDYILVESLEKVNMPVNVMARILPRSSIFRCGCMLATAVVDPGFNGTLTMGLKNASDQEFKLERNAKIAQIVFEEVEGNSKSYNGRYQGGKVV
ncbi:MAG: dCTP deaminase [Candidatus Altiarchaeales archaeon]|nr:dCTP deaminase [Candidatus Altiarchaeales archaeon]